MIEFTGIPTGEFKDICVRRHKKDAMKYALIFGAIISTVIIALTFLLDKLIVLFLAVPAVLIAASAIWPIKKEQYKLFSKNITIAKDGEMVAETHFGEILRAVSQVEEVVDVGGGYIIKFYHEHRTDFFLCQKDLLVKGTLDEFENFFKDKITRSV